MARSVKRGFPDFACRAAWSGLLQRRSGISQVRLKGG